MPVSPSCGTLPPTFKSDLLDFREGVMLSVTYFKLLYHVQYGTYKGISVKLWEASQHSEHTN